MSKTTDKRKDRADAREAFVESQLDEDPAAAVMKARLAAKNALAVAQSVAVLQQIIPSWPRRERRALAAAMRLGGAGYTKNPGQHG